jgi:lysophospholipase L1-like esterase
MIVKQDASRPIQHPLRSALILIAISIVLAGLLAEAMARYVLDDGMNFDLEMWKYARDIKRVSANAEIAHEHIPGASGFYMGVPVAINSAGLRDREYPPEKPPGMTRTLMLGDSVTFGWGVKSEDTPSKLLEEKLNSGLAAPRHEVINTGVGNYNTTMEVAYFLERGHLWKPDAVVLNYFINDAEPTPARKNSSIFEHSYAAVMALGAFDSIARTYFGRADWKTYYRDLYRAEAPAWARAKDAVGKLAAYCREHKIRLVIAAYPELHILKDYPFTDVTQAVEASAKAGGTEFIDLLPAVQAKEPESLWVSPGDAHPNVIANREYAGAIAAKLKALYPDLY